MAIHQRAGRILAMLAVGAGLLTAVPTLAHASPTPTTAAQAKKQITELSQQAEIVTEQYNAASITARRDRRAARTAAETMARTRRQLLTLQGQVRHIAIQAYQSGHMTSFAAFVTSKSPQSFLDQLSTIDVIARRQTDTMRRLSETATTAKRTQAQAVAAAAKAQREAHALQQKKTRISRQVGTVRQLLSQLSAAERAALFQQNGTTKPSLTTMASLKKLPPASGKAAIAVKVAEAQLGKPYVWAAAGPNTYDCSGLTLYAWAAAGVTLPHSAIEQYNMGTHVSVSQLEPGDLVFYYSPIHHVGMYVGNGMIIHAPETGDVVRYAPVESWPIAGATRVG